MTGQPDQQGGREWAERFLHEWSRPYFGDDAGDAVAAVMRAAAAATPSAPMVKQEGGVWIVFTWEYGVHVQNIHSAEVEALRVINDQGYGSVAFCAFGQDVSEAAKR